MTSVKMPLNTWSIMIAIFVDSVDDGPHKMGFLEGTWKFNKHNLSNVELMIIITFFSQWTQIHI
jgi:hypothetical protein